LGSLILPSSGSVYLDAQILIYTVERFPAYFDAVLPIWQASRAGELEIVTSELSVLEVMTGPLKTGSGRLIDAYENLLTGSELRLAPISMDVLLGAAKLRATTSLRTPDAIHAATATVTNCVTLITNDVALRSLGSINVQVLRDILGTTEPC